MQGVSSFEWIGLALVCAVAALAAVHFLTPRERRRGGGSGWLWHAANDDAIWIFDGPRMIDASPAAWAFIDEKDCAFDWSRLAEALASRFPDFPVSQDQVMVAGQISLTPLDPSDSGQVLVEWLNDMVRVRLQSDRLSGAVTEKMPNTLRQEIENHRLAVRHMPYPIWRLNAEGRVDWCNTAYDRLRRLIHPDGKDATEPLFPLLTLDAFRDRTRRLPVVQDATSRKIWYDVTVIPTEDGPLCYAFDVDAVVDAENAQRKFVQTLAKTFAQLSIGLAIFDRNRQLALFNPALTDLTALSPEFLSARPNLLTFFDKLRDQRMMPEPKNYNSWRHQMADLVAAASDGRYQETWSLPSGSVYSVSGRPHPDGAIAFLIEDITAEITLTRRFRSDLELGQSILDKLDEGIAVFSADGTLTVTNAAYRALWAVDPDKSFAQVSVVDATRSWQKSCKATPVWGEIRDYVTTRENRAEWGANLQLASGEDLRCEVHPVQNGATMVRFSRLEPASLAQVQFDERVAVRG